MKNITHIYAGDIRKSMRMLTQCRALKDEFDASVLVLGSKFGDLDDWTGIQLKWFDQGKYINVNNLSSGRWKRSLVQIWATIYLVLSSWKRGGIYHFHEHTTLLPAFIFSLFGRGKLVYDLHDMDMHDSSMKNYYSRINAVRRLVEHLVVVRANSLISVSSKMRDFYMNKYPKCKHHTLYSIPPYIDVKKTEKSRKASLVYWGNIAQDRIPFDFIRELQKGEELSLDIYGRLAAHNTLNYQEEKTFLESLSGNVCYHGEFIPSDVSKILSDYKIACFPFKSNRLNIACAMPNKLWQAIENGIPVIIFDGESLQKFVTENKIGKVIQWSQCLEATLCEVKNAVQCIIENYEKYEAAVAKVRVEKMEMNSYRKELLNCYS